VSKVTESFIFRFFQFLNADKVAATNTLMTKGYAFFIKDCTAMHRCHINLLFILIKILGILRLKIDGRIEYQIALVTEKEFGDRFQ
jgi:hypothetical protein